MEELYHQVESALLWLEDLHSSNGRNWFLDLHWKYLELKYFPSLFPDDYGNTIPDKEIIEGLIRLRVRVCSSKITFLSKLFLNREIDSYLFKMLPRPRAPR